MKRFKHISELKTKQEQLQKRQHELEKLIRYGWQDIRSNFISDTISYGKIVLFDKIVESVKNYFAKKE